MKIVFMHVYTKNGVFNNALVKYEDGSEEKITGFDNVLEMVTEYSKQELTLIDDMEKDKIIIEEMKKTNKKAIASLAVATVLLIGGSLYTMDSLNKKKYHRDSNDVKKEVMETNTPVPTLTPTATLKPTSTPSPTITALPSIKKVETGIEIEDNGSKYVENLETKIVERDDLCNRVREFIDGTNRSRSAFSTIISDISNECFSNINELYAVFSGTPMKGDKYYLSLYNIFDEGTRDYNALKYFCDKRNSLIENSYKNQVEKTKKELYALQDEFTNFVFKNKPIIVDGRNIYYYSLNDFSKLILSDMNLFTLFTIEVTEENVSKNYKVIINGEKVSFDKLLEKIQENISKASQNIEGMISYQYTK